MVALNWKRTDMRKGKVISGNDLKKKKGINQNEGVEVRRGRWWDGKVYRKKMERELRM